MIDFQQKIIYINNKLDLDRTTKLFWDETKTKYKSRKATVLSWINNGNKPNKFKQEYKRYPINDWFNLDFFQHSTLEEFQLEIKKFIDTPLIPEYVKKYRYLYFYDMRNKTIKYLNITYSNSNIQIGKTYNHKGKIKEHGGVIYFITKDNNSSKILHLSFNKTLFLLEKKELYGISLSTDKDTSNPKSSFVLLRDKKANPKEEKIIRSRLNLSNVQIINNEIILTETEGYIKNLSTHLKSLNRTLSLYSDNEIFFNILLYNFNLMFNNLENFDNGILHLDSFSKTFELLLKNLEKSILQNKKLKILYTLHNEDDSIFSEKLYNYILNLYKNGIISFEFTVIINKEIVIDKVLEKKLAKFEELGLIKFKQESTRTLIFDNIVFINDSQFAIIKKRNQNICTVYNPKQKNKIIDILQQYNNEIKKTKNLYDVLYEKNSLNGKWYFYAYGDKLHIMEIDIDRNEIEMTLINPEKRKYEGELYEKYDNIIFFTNFGLIKFPKYERGEIKFVSFISGQRDGNDKAVILFAILSRWKLENEDIREVFSKLVDKESSPYEKASFKLSLELDGLIKKMIAKYNLYETNKKRTPNADRYKTTP